ncbi:MAG: hypothetical protein F2754_15920, partial [Actinobacteria bacterium]|nr:hypothetical protein [Actinomycetota bacterium]
MIAGQSLEPPVSGDDPPIGDQPLDHVGGVKERGARAFGQILESGRCPPKRVEDT